MLLDVHLKCKQELHRALLLWQYCCTCGLLADWDNLACVKPAAGMTTLIL